MKRLLRPRGAWQTPVGAGCRELRLDALRGAWGEWEVALQRSARLAGTGSRWCCWLCLSEASQLSRSPLQTGYMFGKGIYFADMVSKSANYCHTSQGDPVGLVLLGEVALGNM